MDRMTDLHEIQKLKARYFRLMDTRQFDALGEVFTEDLKFYIENGPLAPGSGAPAFDGRKTFDFAKDMGLETIVSEPGEKDFPKLDELCGEYEINIAIHDHPKPSHSLLRTPAPGARSSTRSRFASPSGFVMRLQ